MQETNNESRHLENNVGIDLMIDDHSKVLPFPWFFFSIAKIFYPIWETDLDPKKSKEQAPLEYFCFGMQYCLALRPNWTVLLQSVDKIGKISKDIRIFIFCFAKRITVFFNAVSVWWLGFLVKQSMMFGVWLEVCQISRRHERVNYDQQCKWGTLSLKSLPTTLCDYANCEKAFIR